MKFADKIRFYFLFIYTFKLRKQFFKQNNSVKLPPAYYIYETFNLNYYSFYNKSIETAQWLISKFEKYLELENLKILDWGCGPGRVIRHLPVFINNTCRLYGTDYNKKYIKWCEANISGISFEINRLEPPLSFRNNYFDIVYGISIFTHLSEEMHYTWFNELIRVTKQGGIILLTLQGIAFADKLTDPEKKQFKKGNLIIKANTKEGHRTFSAFQPVPFVKKLAGNNVVLEHEAGGVKNGKPEQDVWVIRKV